ncbi:MAG TPA: serine/threonine-protein kinase, partial [Gemmatimonadaceae bacterium]|nr:serine/threonine-protein kinase [Gemmatimonadaceae bacterium]
MSDERIARALDLFERVLGLDPAARPGFLSRECADDPQLRRRVEAMLRADGRDHTLLDGAAVPLAPALAPSGSGWTGRRVGPFRLQRELGRGGMGVVYLAERDDVGMRVAVKLLAGHFVAPERVARFDYERRLLARLEHPNIARFLDAGVADDGTPWLAMEYVAGSPIDQHSDARCLMVSERLTLFAQACEAVAHAHRNLLVHRDLKPSNVLVSDAGVLKLVDFGIAKLLAPGPDEDGFGAPVTMEAGTGPMTPEYASPEQLRGEKLTTASDVYQLGIVLHELLTGRRPVTRSGHPIRPFDRTSGVEPTRPSEVVASDVRPEQIPTGPTARTSADLSALRRASPRLLKRQLEGDLDAILQTALHPDLSRRYASAQSLVDDIRRFQRGEPVLARTPTRRYRLRKAVRRHKVAVGLAGALALLTFVSAVGLGVQAHKLSVERDRAEQVSLMLERLVRTADPTSGPDSAREFGALREVQRAALEGVAKEPDAWGRLLIVVGVTHRNAGRAD